MKRLILSCVCVVMTLLVEAATITLADPTIYAEDGVYYLTGTSSGSGFVMYKSTDLIHWERCGNATGGLALHKDDVWGTSGFWAPQIFKHDGSYYMAYTANELIAIAKADSPMGPFKQEVQQELPHDTGQIDPFVFIDDDGRKYLYYVRFVGGNTLYVNELNDDFQTFKPGTLKKCLGAEEGWELTREFNDAKITEGPTVIKDGGYYYLIYSANHYQDINYAVGYAYSTSPTGPWKKTGRPFISRHNTGINGTGHGDLLKDADGNWYYVFHVHQSNSQVGTRRTAIVPLTLTDDPDNKFVPQVERMVLLTDDASPSQKMPEASVRFEADGVTYSVTNDAKGYVQVEPKDPVRFGGYEGVVDIPGQVTFADREYAVKAVAAGAFYKCPDLRRVSLQEGVSQLGAGAFEKSGIRTVELPATVSSMGYLTFRDCSNLLDVIVHRSTAPSLAASCFPETTLTNGKLWVDPGTEDKYKDHSVWGTFKRISGVETGTKKYDFAADGIFYDIVSEEDATVQPCAQTTQWASYRGPLVVVPATVDHNGKTYTVTAIGRGCFYDSRLVESVLMPEGVTTIGTSAFTHCLSMRSVTIPQAVTSFGTTVFSGCESLKEVVCLAATPPAATASVFPSDTYDGTLFVPYGTKPLYAADDTWKQFANIVELDDTAVTPTYRMPTDTPAEVCNIMGQRMPRVYRGVAVAKGRKYIKW